MRSFDWIMKEHTLIDFLIGEKINLVKRIFDEEDEKSVNLI